MSTDTQESYEPENEDLDSDANPDLPEPARARLRQLEKDKRAWQTDRDKLDRYELKDQLRGAGMDLSDKQITALLASHDGEKTPDELRKTAEELKFVDPIADTDQQDVDAHKQLDNARNGASQPNQQASFEADVAAATNMDELEAAHRRHGKPWGSAG